MINDKGSNAMDVVEIIQPEIARKANALHVEGVTVVSTTRARSSASLSTSQRRVIYRITQKTRLEIQ